MQRTKAGLTRLEWAVVSILIGLLISVFLNRFLDILVDAERVNLLQIESGIKSALGLELSRRAVKGGLESIGNLQYNNPMDLLQEKPHNYLGEMVSPKLASLPEGAWVFDSSRRVLIYTVEHTEYFQTDLPGRPRAEYRLVLTYKDANQNGRYEYITDRLSGMNLATVGQYQWTLGKN